MTVAERTWHALCLTVAKMGDDEFLTKMQSFMGRRVLTAMTLGEWKNPSTGSRLIFRQHGQLPDAMMEVRILRRSKKSVRLLLPGLMGALVYEMLTSDGDNVAFHGYQFDRTQVRMLFTEYLLRNVGRHLGGPGGK